MWPYVISSSTDAVKLQKVTVNINQRLLGLSETYRRTWAINSRGCARSWRRSTVACSVCMPWNSVHRDRVRGSCIILRWRWNAGPYGKKDSISENPNLTRENELFGSKATPGILLTCRRQRNADDRCISHSVYPEGHSPQLRCSVQRYSDPAR